MSQNVYKKKQQDLCVEQLFNEYLFKDYNTILCVDMPF